MKKFFLYLAFALIISLIWYLFIKKYDYQVNFEVKTFPGAISQTIKGWSALQKQSQLIDQADVTNLTQKISYNDSTFIFNWNIEKINDSLSKVTVYAKDQNNSLHNKLKIPFEDTNFEKRTRKSLIEFGHMINDHIKNFKVTIIGKESVETTFCACTNLKTAQREKAKGIMRDYPLLTDFLLENNVELNGTPFLEVTEWNQIKDTLSFKFCFPVIQTDLLPSHPEIEFRTFFGRNGLKAVYNGNYITSDRAWYKLIDYANENKIDVLELPIEVFYNNPNFGGDEMKWQTEVYLPLNKK